MSYLFPNGIHELVNSVALIRLYSAFFYTAFAVLVLSVHFCLDDSAASSQVQKEPKTSSGNDAPRTLYKFCNSIKVVSLRTKTQAPLMNYDDLYIHSEHTPAVSTGLRTLFYLT